MIRISWYVSNVFIKPNSITLAGSKLVRSWFEAGRLRTCLRPASNQLA